MDKIPTGSRCGGDDGGYYVGSGGNGDPGDGGAIGYVSDGKGGFIKKVTLGTAAVKAIEAVLSKGNDVEIRMKKAGLQIMELKRSTKYST